MGGDGLHRGLAVAGDAEAAGRRQVSAPSGRCWRRAVSAGASLFVLAVVALLRRRPLRFLRRLLLALALLSAGALAATVGLGMHGYRALTHERVAARVLRYRLARPTRPRLRPVSVANPDSSL